MTAALVETRVAPSAGADGLPQSLAPLLALVSTSANRSHVHRAGITANAPCPVRFALDSLEPRYHVPRSQVWGGSRGRQSGHVHLHVTEQFDLGRIHRAPGQALCGRSGWYERPLDCNEIVPLCPRCREIKDRV